MPSTIYVITKRASKKPRQSVESLNVHPSWPPELVALIGTFDEKIVRPPQRPITELKDPFEGWEPESD